MASLQAALPYLLGNEGEFSNTAGDVGGETLDGIARKMHPEWAGWAVLDSLNLPLHDPRAADALIDARWGDIGPLVADFYLKNYWLYDGIKSQPVATKILDGAVNMEGDGRQGAAIRALQLAIGEQFHGVLRVIDGVYGPNTELMANRCDPDGLLYSLAKFYSAHYNAILDAHPEYAKFKNGWLARAQKLPGDAKGATA